MKIAYISRHPAPYRDPLMARLDKTAGLEIDFFDELSADDGHGFWDLREHGYRASPLYPAETGRLGRVIHLLRHVVFGRYDFVLWSGFQSPELVAAMLVSALLGKRYGFSADTIKENARTYSLRRLVKWIIVKGAEIVFVPGNAGAHFWNEVYGIGYAKILKGAYALDGAGIRKRFQQLHAERNVIRSECGIQPDDVVFLMVANMIKTRHYPITAEAFVRFAQGKRGTKFVIVGHGPEYERMRAYSVEHPEIVVVDGVSFEKMLSLYAMADVYVHGGTEPASTALVIGACAGLPLVSSKAVGCSADVLIDGESGIEVQDYLSVDCWERAFSRLWSSRDAWGRYGEAAQKLAMQLDADVIYQSLLNRLR